ncbi:alpha/beta hydrolase [Streptomyces sp. NPDC057638]|uniref:alpha/beta hydrolase n=1 Tax=Streptomyces sp. NPDC057638 TaxID=3346190 RepID=UPI0036AD8A87
MQTRRLIPLFAGGVLATTLAPVAVAAPTTSAANATTATSTATVTRTATQGFTPRALDWERCAAELPASFECAILTVPLDYTKPQGRTIEVAVSRIKAGDPAKRRGVLLFNPGGPGGPGIGMPLEMAGLPASVKERYDFIGFDPRGIGQSTPVSCYQTRPDLQWPRSHRTFDANVTWAKSVAQKCQRSQREVLRHITTRNTARDMDTLRAALGEKKISYFGVSYGTALGAVYTQMFPKRADRVVLDSAVDPAQMWRATFQEWGPQAEPAFRRWAAWAAERHATYGLGDTPRKVTRTFYDLVAQADRKPFAWGTKTYDGAGIRAAVRPYIFLLKEGSAAVADLRKAAAGKPSQGVPVFDDMMTDNSMASLWSVLCGDANWPRDVEKYRADSVRDQARYPLFGDHSSGITPCAFWEKPVEPVTKIDNKVPALIVQNEWDSQTPLSTAQAMHRAMKGSAFLTIEEGEGHGVLGYQTNACAEKIAASYLTTGKLPGGTVTCQAEPTATKRADARAPRYLG